jgi:hypothetical protein
MLVIEIHKDCVSSNLDIVVDLRKVIDCAWCTCEDWKFKLLAEAIDTIGTINRPSKSMLVKCKQDAKNEVEGWHFDRCEVGGIR